MSEALSADTSAQFVDNAAPSVPTVADAAKAIAGLRDVVKAKPWHQSLTVQGALVAGAAGAVVAYGTPVLTAVGMSASSAAELAHGVAGVLASVGALMSVIGRLRLGGLK